MANQIINYDTFTDIEFNPNKSKNCQAEACSIYVYLYKSNLLDFALSSKENFLQVVYQEKKGDSYFSTKQNNFKKISLFDYEEEAKQSKVIHSKKIPKYRNISFDNEWENKSLGSTVEIIMGQSPDSKNYTDNPNDYILVQGNADMQNGRVVPRVWTTQITKLAEKGDLILSVRAPVGDIGKTDYNVVLGRGVAAIKGNEFIFQLLSRMKQTNYWAKFSTGSTFESINSSDIKSAEIYLPSQDEQSAIGSLFRTLDDLLTSYKDNLANYQTLKTTMLSKMFPKDGQTVPEIRLKGFEGEWKEKEFSKLVKRVTQSSDSDSLPKVEFEDIVSGQGQLNKDISRKFDNRKGIHFKPGYTLYGKLRPYLNNWLLPKFEGVALGDFWVFDPNGNDSNFIYYLVQSNRYQKVANDTSGTKMPRSDWKSVSTTVFAIPQTIAEQQAIGAYFSNLDNLIATHQEKNFSA